MYQFFVIWAILADKFFYQPRSLLLRQYPQRLAMVLSHFSASAPAAADVAFTVVAPSSKGAAMAFKAGSWVRGLFAAPLAIGKSFIDGVLARTLAESSSEHVASATVAFVEGPASTPAPAADAAVALSTKETLHQKMTAMAAKYAPMGQWLAI